MEEDKNIDINTDTAPEAETDAAAEADASASVEEVELIEDESSDETVGSSGDEDVDGEKLDLSEIKNADSGDTEAIGPDPAAAAAKKKKKRLNIILLVVMTLCLIGCLIYIGVVLQRNAAARSAYGKVNEIALNREEKETVMMDTDGDGIEDTPVEAGGEVKDGPKGFSPVDLPALKKINKDVYAWLRVPGTYIDYPVAQSDIEDNYYLHRSIYKQYLFAGMIYTQSCNKKDFSDPITVVYGHNMRSTTMFSTLHYFAKADFFKEHEYFYIYTEDSVLTYRIVSAYKSDNRHIMNNFDFTDNKELYNYQRGILSPTSTLKNTRENINLDENSKIVILSTCMSNDKSSRFLVNGVLISDVPIEK